VIRRGKLILCHFLQSLQYCRSLLHCVLRAVVS
jgi:hypothetical protein